MTPEEILGSGGDGTIPTFLPLFRSEVEDTLAGGFIHWLSQWPTFKLFGDSILVGKISLNFYLMDLWLSKFRFFFSIFTCTWDDPNLTWAFVCFILGGWNHPTGCMCFDHKLLHQYPKKSIKNTPLLRHSDLPKKFHKQTPWKYPFAPSREGLFHHEVQGVVAGFFIMDPFRQRNDTWRSMLVPCGVLAMFGRSCFYTSTLRSIGRWLRLLEMTPGLMDVIWILK